MDKYLFAAMEANPSPMILVQDDRIAHQNRNAALLFGWKEGDFASVRIPDHILSAEEESFTNGLLEYPQYTRPAEFRGMRVPEILLNGHHANIQAWRKAQSILKTEAVRPELVQNIVLTKQEKKMLEQCRQELEAQPNENKSEE